MQPQKRPENHQPVVSTKPGADPASAIRNAIALRSPAATICHSDRGSQFRSKKVRRPLQSHGLEGSMGRGRGRGRRRHGDILLTAAKERPGHPTLGNPRRTPPCDRHLDRDQVQPPPPAGTRQAHPGRVGDDLHRRRRGPTTIKPSGSTRRSDPRRWWRDSFTGNTPSLHWEHANKLRRIGA